MKERIGTENKFVKVLDQVVCKGTTHLYEEMDRVLGVKGEGMMLKDPNSKYERKRSSLLLKVKKFEDAEAEVIGHEDGKGRCKGMLGALRVKHCKTGVQFKIGSGFDDKQRKNPPKIGTIVTFKFQDVTKANVPRFPIFMRIRHDHGM